VRRSVVNDWCCVRDLVTTVHAACNMPHQQQQQREQKQQQQQQQQPTLCTLRSQVHMKRAHFINAEH
jgi:hypothetical protein